MFSPLQMQNTVTSFCISTHHLVYRCQGSIVSYFQITISNNYSVVVKRHNFSYVGSELLSRSLYSLSLHFFFLLKKAENHSHIQSKISPCTVLSCPFSKLTLPRGTTVSSSGISSPDIHRQQKAVSL